LLRPASRKSVLRGSFPGIPGLIGRGLVLIEGQAAAIAAYREASGPFMDWDSLLKVPGLDPETLDPQKRTVVF